MGCNTSVNSDLQIPVDLSPNTIFKSERLVEKSTIRTSLKDFCKKVIQSNIQPSFISRSMSFQIVCKGKEYSLKDNVNLNDLFLTPDDRISINVQLLDEKIFEVTLKHLTGSMKEERKQVTRSTLVSSLVSRNEFKVLLGHLQLDHDQCLEDYDVINPARLIVIENGMDVADLQTWKIKKSGLVLEALCMNLTCQAYKQRICVNLGLGEFNIDSETSPDNTRECEVCGEGLGNICKITFVHCQVSYSMKCEDDNIRDISIKVKNCLEDNCKTWQNIVKVSQFK